MGRRHSFEGACGITVPPHEVGVGQGAAQQGLFGRIAPQDGRALVDEALHDLPHRRSGSQGRLDMRPCICG